MSNTWQRALVVWIYASIAVTGVFGAMYVAVQQNYRQGLNDPQIQVAEDAARALSQGASVQSVVTSPMLVQHVDIAQSLALYVTVFDANGKPLASSGYLDGALPSPPPSAVQSGWHRTGAHSFLTWQPRPDVRSAIVLAPYTSPEGGGYVLAGRNMREVENRIMELTGDLFIAWLITEAALLLASFALRFVWPR